MSAYLVCPKCGQFVHPDVTVIHAKSCRGSK